MSPTKYIYLLIFKDEPLFKIGVGTKNSDSSYDRIKVHISNYGKVFNLENSYEIITPGNYSVNSLERQLLDITSKFTLSDDKYKGKDGYTELRHIDGLDFCLSMIELQSKMVPIETKKGILIINKSHNNTKLKKEPVDTDKYNVSLQLLKIETHLSKQYNTDKILTWSSEINSKWLKLNLSFTDESFLTDLDCMPEFSKDKHYSRRCKYSISFDKTTFKDRGSGGFNIEHSLCYDGSTYRICFGIPTDMNMIGQNEPLETWFKRVFINPLDIKKQIFNLPSEAIKIK